MDPLGVARFGHASATGWNPIKMPQIRAMTYVQPASTATGSPSCLPFEHFRFALGWWRAGQHQWQFNILESG